MARILGVSTTALLRWEAGEVGPELPGAVKFALEYFKLSDTLLNDEVFSAIDERIEEMQQLREQLERDRATSRTQLDKYRAQLAASEAALPPAPPVA